MSPVTLDECTVRPACIAYEWLRVDKNIPRNVPAVSRVTTMKGTVLWEQPKDGPRQYPPYAEIFRVYNALSS